MIPTKTDWFDGDKFKPFNVGVYEVMHLNGLVTYHQYWDGFYWLPYRHTAKDAQLESYKGGFPSQFQNLFFRGFTTKQDN